MKVTMFLMVSAVALLVGPAVANPTPHLNENGKSVIDLVDKYNESLSREYFVDEVVKGDCGALFFCKVHHILHHHQLYGNMTEEKQLVRNLKQYIDSIPKMGNCKELLKDGTNTGIKKPIPNLLKNLTECIQQRNLKSI
ncbi:hypothetical protein EPR50_G00139580 [Perca flavescens]|uniref:Uncharacterized protein n=1 Tax=Perca flavescens TaxID=8167 RepID=A0A484CN71_PERFV|nr:hypothetical protein EPR50_G00139580 [Perca flavescens]